MGKFANMYQQSFPRGCSQRMGSTDEEAEDPSSRWIKFAKLQIILLPKESAQEIKLKSLSSIISSECRQEEDEFR